MKKTMRKSALLSSIAMLVVSAIVLTSATYAWFSSSKVVEVEELKASVKVTTGLLISVDKGGEWGTLVDFEDAVAVKEGWGAGYPNDMVFDPVSTADGEDWFTATYEDGVLKEGTVEVGTDLIAVPLWVTGPVGEDVEAMVNFGGTDSQAAKCVKFALVPASGDAGDVIGEYKDAVAADGSTAGFMGISKAGSTIAADGAFVSDGGKNIAEVGADGGINFKIVEGTTTENPMKFVAFIWLEGNDEDCDMLKFDVAGEDINFSMTLNIVE